ncbi:MAG: TIGR01244 family sulfur transferase [Pseudomonadota bacterium]
MDIRQITPNYAVAPQIEPTDLPDIAAQGFTTIICNRPDFEIPAELSAQVMQTATEAAGLSFVLNPVDHSGLTMQIVELQRETVANAAGPVLAYCASGNRSTIVWGLGQAGTMPTDDIINAAGAAGYSLHGLRGQLDAMAR